MNPAGNEEWVPVRGFGSAYEIELSSGRVRSRDRTLIDSLGRVRKLQGVELAQQQPARGGGPRVCLCVRGHRRTMPIRTLLARAGRGRAGG